MMKNNPWVVKLKTFAKTESLSSDDVKQLTKEQAANVLGISQERLPTDFFSNLKGQVTKQIRREKEIAEFNVIKELIQDVLISAFPDCILEDVHTRDKPFLKVWFKGKPVEPKQQEVPG